MDYELGHNVQVMCRSCHVTDVIISVQYTQWILISCGWENGVNTVVGFQLCPSCRKLLCGGTGNIVFDCCVKGNADEASNTQKDVTT